MKKSSGNCSDTNMDLNTKQAIQSAAEEKPSRCILQQIQCFKIKKFYFYVSFGQFVGRTPSPCSAVKGLMKAGNILIVAKFT